ncbi:MAG: NmrA family NAD(P)-binding protein, partial [Acidimicrobiia bacterium]
VVAADLTQPATLSAAFDGVYGVFANTNSFASHDTDEVAQGVAAVSAAKAAGVKHYVWSTLPNVDGIGGGAYSVPHFSNKARVNDAVAGAGFPFFTFVEPPFYYQNLVSPMYTKNPGSDGTPTWSILMDADARGMHMGDINEYGNLVAGVFEHPDTAGHGEYLSFAGDLLSWNDIVVTLRSQGHNIAVQRTTDDPWHTGDMFGYFAEYTYFGPDAEDKIDAANAVTTEPFTSFAIWAKENMPV